MKKRYKMQIRNICILLVLIAVIVALGFFVVDLLQTIFIKQQVDSEQGAANEIVSINHLDIIEISENSIIETTNDVEESTVVESEFDVLNQKIDEIMNEMSLEQKVAQLFMVTPEAITGYQTVTKAGTATEEAYQKYPVGGVIYFSKNLLDKDQTKEMLSNMKEIALDYQQIPVFLSIDEEGGSVSRIASNPNMQIDNVMDLAKIGAALDPKNAYDAGKHIGNYLNELGFNLNYAPVADVLSNDNNTVVKNRSFGADASVVDEMCKAYSDGLIEERVISCYKHFPGHGSTSGDTHDGYAYTELSKENLINSDFIPFQSAIEFKIPMIMVGHISVPSITGDDTPASMSSIVITDILRNELGFDGVVTTDALNMGAITQKYGADEACIMAISAGVDIVMMPENFESAYQSLCDAVNGGQIEEKRIDESVRRILNLKLKYISE